MISNNQAPEKQELRKDGALNVVKVFLTIQGEGPFVGRRATFIRLAGCNLQCPFCDTDYTSNRDLLYPEEVITLIEQESAPTLGLVVITGGEPLRQNLRPLIENLLSRGYLVQIETNGTLYQDLPYSSPNLTIVCSPKTGAINSKLKPWIAAYKYVLHKDSIGVDGLPIKALDHSAKPQVARPDLPYREITPIYVQPIDVQDAAKNEQHLEATIQSVMDFNYTLCLQTHKIIGME